MDHGAGIGQNGKANVGQEIMRTWVMVVLLLVVAGCSGGGFISSNFVLSHDSPLPEWFKSNQSKQQFIIDIYETTFSSMGKVRITVLDSQGKMIDRVEGKWQWHPETLTRSSISYPKWILIKVKNTAEIYEQLELTNTLKIVRSVSSCISTPENRKSTPPNSH